LQPLGNKAVSSVTVDHISIIIIIIIIIVIFIIIIINYNNNNSSKPARAVSSFQHRDQCGV